MKNERPLILGKGLDRMTGIGFAQIALYLLILTLGIKPLGWYMAQVYAGRSCGLNRLLRPFERRLYRLCGIRSKETQGWQAYLSSMLIFNIMGLLVLYGLQRFQYFLPFNPQNFSGVPSQLAFNTAASFVTNADWQAYSGESTLSYLSQTLGLTVQNFISAATGMALAIAFIRGLVAHEDAHLGNYWVDLIRGILYILLPGSMLLALILCSQGVIQNFKPYEKIPLMESLSYTQPAYDSLGHVILDADYQPRLQTIDVNEQTLPMGPVASQVAIKQLGTNGGGFFSSNSAHPFENPTPLSNFFEMLAILLIPAAFCHTFGLMCKDKRQGYALLAAMFIILVPLIFVCVGAESAGNPAFHSLPVDQSTHALLASGGNMEGKETRFGVVTSALWATLTTATSSGSVNAMLDSFSALGGLIPLWLMHLGEVIFGGVGTGLYGMLMLVILTVFIAGLMVGRTPEYLGKKIEPFEMKMACVVVLFMPLLVLLLTAIATLLPSATAAVGNPGAHGFTEILYTFTSMGNANGSAFAGLDANRPFYNLVGGLEMLILRYWLAIPALALAGSLARKKLIPESSGTLNTHTPLFIFLLLSVTLIIGALTFFPALALGPIAEQLGVWRLYGY